MKLDRSIVINRPPEAVFNFYAVNHLHNHPRWDPHMKLEKLTEGPVGVGTQFRRQHSRTGTPIDGVMDVVEFEPERSMGVHIVDQTPNGALEVNSRAILEPVDAGAATRITLSLDIPAMEASMDPTMVEASLQRIKELIETDT